MHIPAGDYIFHFIQFSRARVSYQNFMKREPVLTWMILNQVITLQKLYSCHYEVVSHSGNSGENGYVSFVVVTIWSSLSRVSSLMTYLWIYNLFWFVMNNTRFKPLVGQQFFILSQDLNSPIYLWGSCCSICSSLCSVLWPIVCLLIKFNSSENYNFV